MGLESPPYLRVADDLRRRIAAGEWEVGEKLPSRAQLAAAYGVGANVLQKAQERLIIEGVLEGRAGSGTYVRTPRERRRMVRTRQGEQRGGAPFRADMAELGSAGTWESHSQARTPAPDHIAQRLGITPGDLCVRTHYEYLADGQPVQTSVSWEPMAITGETPIVLPEMGPLAGKGVVERMRSIGITVDTALEVPRPARATQAQANVLGISLGDLVLIIERTYYDTGGRAVETADIVVPDVRWEVAYEIGIPAPQ
ncbi:MULTISPECIES: GntR family transcriptional regulator [unclassified Streptomyces]|uniref:GntR family transcriptional regulator n=1 Tax=unclassified Streptomyces TaxID=2593676 RepID=UPI0023662DEC|nr:MULTISPECIES: GntR family transcriptional regulator [unclassified Streptomyces]MDF3141811.1 GntR family transcriptional regulator [Streptomyces sp. T21Q-yed]WDF45100.1 GntR family transcriptional regulator [Streptomyces sp. T12]